MKRAVSAVLLLQLFYGPLSGTTRVSQYQKKHSPTHIYPGHQSSSIYYDHSILPVQFTCLAVFAQSLFKSSLLYLLVWHPPLHTPYVSSSNYFLLFTTPANAIATCFAVVLRLCHLILDRRCWDWLCHALVPRRSDILLSLRL